MSFRNTTWSQMSQLVRHIPFDLLVVVGFVALVELVMLVPAVEGSAAQVILRLPILLFLPGYVLVAIAFPERPTEPSQTYDERRGVVTRVRSIRHDGVDLVERGALAFGMSIALIPLYGLGLTLAGFGLDAIVLVLPLLVVFGAIIGTVRRAQVPSTDRFVLPVRYWYERLHAFLFGTDNVVHLAINIVLVVSVLLALSTMAYALAVPPADETYSGFYLLTEDDDGELIADNYPTEFVAGESQELIFGIENRERATSDYTVVIELQRVDTSDDEATILERSELSRMQVTVEDGAVEYVTHEVEPTMLGSDLRLSYTLYLDEAPDEPDADTAYRQLHLWIDVDDEQAADE